MGNCTYCGNPAGFLRSSHAECEQQHVRRQNLMEGGKKRIAFEASQAIRGNQGLVELENKISAIEKSSLIPHAQCKEFLATAWEMAVDQFLEDGILDETEERRLVEFKNHFALSDSDLDKNGALTRTVKAIVLRDVLGGELPTRMSVDGNIPINFQKGEQLVWAFSGADYLEDKVKRQYIGGSKGISVRIMKGVYYRTGTFKGHTIERTERTHIDTGWVVATNKHIYFASPSKSLRIPYSKIISFIPFSDGFGLLRDATTAKPQIFVTGDGWFSYNLVTNLAQL